MCLHVLERVGSWSSVFFSSCLIFFLQSFSYKATGLFDLGVMTWFLLDVFYLPAKFSSMCPHITCFPTQTFVCPHFLVMMLVFRWCTDQGDGFRSSGPLSRSYRLKKNITDYRLTQKEKYIVFFSRKKTHSKSSKPPFHRSTPPLDWSMPK